MSVPLEEEQVLGVGDLVGIRPSGLGTVPASAGVDAVTLPRLTDLRSPKPFPEVLFPSPFPESFSFRTDEIVFGRVNDRFHLFGPSSKFG